MDISIKAEKIEASINELLPSQNRERAELFFNLALLFTDTDQNKVISYCMKALDEAMMLDEKTFALSILNELTWAHKVKGEYSDSLRYLNKSLDVLGETGDEDKLSTILARIGSIRLWMAQYDLALDCFIKSIKIKKKLSNRKGIGFLYTNMANVYYSMGQHRRSIEFYEKAIGIFREFGIEKSLSIAYSGLGISLFALGDKEASLDCHLKSLEFSRRVNDKKLIAQSLMFVGSAQRELGDIKSSILNLSKALESHKLTGDRRGEAETLHNIGVTLAASGELDHALDSIKNGIRIAKEIGAADLLMECYKSLSLSYELGSNYMEALRFHKKFKSTFEEIFTENNRRKFNQLQQSYEQETREKENEIFRLKNVELVEKNAQLNRALSEVKALSGLLPICAVCKKVRSDTGYWEQIETYISHHSEAEFSHGICPDCAGNLYPEQDFSKGSR